MTEEDAESSPAARMPPAANDRDASGLVVSGAFWNLLTSVLPSLYTLAISIVSARALGPADMGRQSFIAWASLSVVTLFATGIPRALIRFIGKTIGEGRPGAVKDLLRWAWRLEAIGAVVGGTFLILVGVVGGHLATAWALAGVACSFGVMQAVPAAVLGAFQRWREAALIGLVTGAVGTVAVIVVLSLGGGITEMFAVELVMAATNLLWAGALAQRAIADETGDAEAEDDAPLRREVVRYAWIASLQVVFHLVVWRRSELFFLNRYSSPEQLALYAIPAAVVWAIQRLPGGAGMALVPAVATLLGAGDHERIRSGVGRAMRLSLLLSLPMTAGAAALGPATLRIIYGSEYAGLTGALLVLLATFPVVMVANVSGSVLQGYGRIGLMLRSSIVATAVNVAASIALIPDRGAFGAAIANSVAQLTSAGLNLWFAARLVTPQWEAARMLRALVASLATAGAAAAPLLVLPVAPALIIGFVLGAGTFCLLAALLDVLPHEDGVWLRERIATKLPGRVRPLGVRLVLAATARARQAPDGPPPTEP